MYSPEIRDIRLRARGRWRVILEQHGINVPTNPTHHGPCPICGGKDRFRFDDRNGMGSWYCNQCEPHAGDGLALVYKVRRCSVGEAVRMVEQVLAADHPGQNRIGLPSSSKPDAAMNLWRASQPDSGRISEYIRHRGLSCAVSTSLRFHTLKYWDATTDQLDKNAYPVMIAEITDRNGNGLGIHITYLDPLWQGKAKVPTPKKMYKYQGVDTIKGAAIRLQPADPKLPLVLLKELKLP